MTTQAAKRLAPVDCLAGVCTCPRCGKTMAVPKNFTGTGQHLCAVPEPVGLGDMVAAGLDAVGITKDRVQAVARRVGIKDCGCRKRHQRLNELGRKLGIGR